jgi:hypothetical protein
MKWLCRLALTPTLLFLLIATASAAPDYIEASPDELKQAYGEEIADRAFSDELTETRKTIIKDSIVPLHDCPADPEFVLREAYPFSSDPTDVIWLERYEVACKDTLRRAILMLLKDGAIQAVPMVPGATIADPNLQIDAANFVKTAALAKSAEPCGESAIIDTEVVQKPPQGGGMWKERWSVQACGKVYGLNVLFTPAEDGGTNITVTSD